MTAILYSQNGLSSVQPHAQDVDGSWYPISAEAAERIKASNAADIEAEEAMSDEQLAALEAFNAGVDDPDDRLGAVAFMLMLA